MFRVALLVGLAACSNGHSCKLGATCEDYATKDETGLATLKHGCDGMKGTWATSSCPSAGRIGTCTVPREEGSDVINYYGGGPDAFTVANATANCEHERHGTWTRAK